MYLHDYHGVIYGESIRDHSSLDNLRTYIKGPNQQHMHTVKALRASSTKSCLLTDSISFQFHVRSRFTYALHKLVIRPLWTVLLRCHLVDLYYLKQKKNVILGMGLMMFRANQYVANHAPQLHGMCHPVTLPCVYALC